MAMRGVFVTEFKKAKIVPKLSICKKDSEAIGCAFYGGHIELLKRFWDNYDCGWREALVFHEHAHADLELGHHKDTLMDPYIENGYRCLVEDRGACLDQLAERYKAVLFFLHDAKRVQLQTPRLH